MVNSPEDGNFYGSNYIEIKLIVDDISNNLDMLITFDLPINPKDLRRI